MMNSIFRELLYEGVLANYIDDFIIPAKIKEELEERTIQFWRLQRNIICVLNSQNVTSIWKKS